MTFRLFDIYLKEFMKSARILLLSLGFFCAATSFAQTAAPASKASAPVASASAPAAKAAPKTAKTAAPATAAAAGGGDGKVWVNSKSKVYHCEGTKLYGKTKAGEYMTEADAKSKGNRADHGKACAK